MVFQDLRLDDRIDRAALFAEAAEDALREVDVVARRAARTVGTHIRLDRDRERRAHCLAELAGDAALFAVLVAAQRVQPAKARRQRSLLFGELHRHLAAERVPAGQGHALDQFHEHEALEKVLEGKRCRSSSNSSHDVVSRLFPDVPGRQQPRAHDQQPHQGDRNEDLPAQAHDLVIPEAREGRADPDEHGHHEEGLEAQPDPARDEVQGRHRRQPAAQEHGHAQDGHEPHAGVFGQEEDREAHARVLDHVAGHDFRLAFHHVERVAVGLGHAGDQVDDEDRQQRQPVPRQEGQAGVRHRALPLAQHDLREVHAARDHDDHQEAEAHRDLVAHHLGRRTQRTQEGVLRVRGPAGDDHAVHLDRGDRHDQQQAGVHVGQRHVGAEGDRHPGRERGHDGHHRAQHEQALAGRRGLDDFLGEQLQAVGQRLQQAERAHAVGAVAHLHEAQQLALPEREVGHRAHERRHDGDDLEQVPEHGPHCARPPGLGDEVQPAVVERVDHAAAPSTATGAAAAAWRPSAVSCSEGARRTRLSSW